MNVGDLKTQFRILIERGFFKPYGGTFYKVESNQGNDNQRNQDIYIKGKAFLQSLEELNDLFKSNADVQKIFDNILINAVNILEDKPKIRSYDAFISNIDSLKSKIQNKDGLSSGVGFSNFIIHSLSSSLGILMTGFGLYAGYHSIMTIAAVATLSSGPWGWLGFSCAVVMMGLFIAGMLAYDAYTNYRFHYKSQITEIEEFADLFKHIPASSNQKEFNVVDGSLTPNFNIEEGEFFMVGGAAQP